MKFLINMSGHPLSDVAKETSKKMFDNIIDVPIPNITMDNSSILKFIDDTMITLKNNKDLSKAILTNDFSVIPPGMSPLICGTISALHGASGSFPKITYLVRNQVGIFDIGGTIDLQDLRLKYRDFFRA